MRVERWSPAEARAAVASPDLDRLVGVAVGVPAVVIDLSAPGAGPAAQPADEPTGDPTRGIGGLASALTRLPAVAIASGSPDDPEAWDVCVEPGDTLTSVVEGVLEAPLAAVTAAQLLRGAADRDTAEGLLVESWAYASLQHGPEFSRWLEGRGTRVRRPDNVPRVRVDDHGTSVDVVLTRPRLHNLLDAAMRDQLVDAFKALADDDRPIVLRAEGPAFCAGGDTAEFGTVADPATAHGIRSTAGVAPWLVRVASRTTALVDGACVGAGAELAAFCGRVHATPAARFRLPETRMGLIPGAGGTVSIPRRIGRQRTLEWLLSGAELDPDRAHAWGLVDEILPASDAK